MRRALAVLGTVLLWSHSVLAQSAAPKPSFEAADVHVRTHSSNPNPVMTGGVLRGGRYDLRNATMVDLIAMAYDVKPEAVLGGPSWLERDRFDVIAKAPQTTSPDSIKLMLQGLLDERFKLAVRSATKELPGYALIVNGKHKLKAADAPGTSGCQGQPQTPEPGTVPYTVVACRGVSMADFAAQLRFMAGAYVEKPVTDATALKGSWDFDLKWTARAALALAGSDGIALPDALEKQLGLRLEDRAISQPVLEVVSVNQHPTDNPSGVAQNLPSPPPAEFDVADIKLSPPDAGNPIGRLQPGGRLNFQNVPLSLLVQMAWDINNMELIAGPSWLADTKVSVIARTSDDALGGSADGMQLDIDDVRLMLQALLKERFKMKVHMEDRPVTAYTLLADNPKMKKADPSNRSSCKNGAAPNTRDPRNSNPILSRLVTCQNISMAQFAEDLPRIAPGYIRTAVTDATGLEGSWDFSFNFSPAGVGQPGAGIGNDAGGVPVAGFATQSSDPTGAIPLFDALRRQLGIKLEMQKRPLPVLVIDEMERKPIDF